MSGFLHLFETEVFTLTYCEMLTRKKPTKGNRHSSHDILLYDTKKLARCMLCVCAKPKLSEH